MDTESLTYKEIADRLGTLPESARKLAKRRRWQKIKGNDGEVRICVPVSYFEDARVSAQEPAQDDDREPSRELQIMIDGLKALLESERRRADAAEVDRDRWHELATRPWWRRLAG